ncbi:MAG: non-homologous end-joining DNA ligase [Desulfuromonadales bacterium]|jgi:bifunctional non-homologous end joining protein LigD
MGLIEKILSDEERQQARVVEMPDWRDPMLATLTHEPFADEDWIFERKLDGERALAYLDRDGQIRLLSRNQKSLNVSYPEIVDALEAQALHGAIFDGEIVAFNDQNVSDFQRLQPRMQASNRAEARSSRIRVYYYLFDCLYLQGHDISACSQRQRKQLLKAALDWSDPLRWTPHRNTEGLTFYRQACTKGWEGVIAKQADASYVSGRSRRWLKFKCIRQQEFVIGGFTEPQGGRIGFGALLLGFYRDGALVYAGKVGAGFDDETLKRLHQRFDRLSRKTSPYDRGDPQGEGIHFLTPRLVCEVAFTEWTDDEHLRHPRFKGLRRDKVARDVHREDAARQPVNG